MEVAVIVGGNNSGKTKIALSMTERPPKLYIATGRITDGEMWKKIMEHKRERKEWDTLVSPTLERDELMTAFAYKAYRSVVLDCTGFLVFNCMEKGLNPTKRIDNLLELLKDKEIRLVIVANEVGLSLVPPSEYSRKYAKLLGNLNQYLVRKADKAFLSIAGQPVRIK